MASAFENFVLLGHEESHISCWQVTRDELKCISKERAFLIGDINRIKFSNSVNDFEIIVTGTRGVAFVEMTPQGIILDS